MIILSCSSESFLSSFPYSSWQKPGPKWKPLQMPQSQPHTCRSEGPRSVPACTQLFENAPQVVVLIHHQCCCCMHTALVDILVYGLRGTCRKPADSSLLASPPWRQSLHCWQTEATPPQQQRLKLKQAPGSALAPVYRRALPPLSRRSGARAAAHRGCRRKLPLLSCLPSSSCWPSLRKGRRWAPQIQAQVIHPAP